MSAAPLTLSDMLRAMALQAEAHAIAGTVPTPGSLHDLATTLNVCARAAEDMEADLAAGDLPAVLPPNVIPFPLARTAR